MATVACGRSTVARLYRNTTK